GSTAALDHMCQPLERLGLGRERPLDGLLTALVAVEVFEEFGWRLSSLHELNERLVPLGGDVIQQALQLHGFTPGPSSYRGPSLLKTWPGARSLHDFQPIVAERLNRLPRPGKRAGPEGASRV